MRSVLPDVCPEPGAESDATDSSLSPRCEKEGKILSRKKESSDSGKDSEEEDAMEEEEDFEDCEEYEEVPGWNYLQTIEEEEEDLEDEDSGNDSDVEKTELETFEMLEQMCEEEARKAKEKGERGRIVSYHEYKRVKGSKDDEDYENQLVFEKEIGVRLKDSKWSGSAQSGYELRPRPPTLINNSSVLTGGGSMKHEPDSKIKSALKRASSKKRKKHKVQFDESLNKFFDADYVILIREECGGGGCECGGGDYCYAEDDDEEELQALDLTPFDPPVEFVDQLTLSPPDGYKDYCIHRTSPDECHQEQEAEWRPEPPKVEDGTTQTTPTSENEQDDDNIAGDMPEKKERYIVETITMTTVTERRIIRETEEASEAASTAKEKEKEMTLTFKLGSNSLKPNSALRQLFPRIASPPPDKSPDSDDDSLQSNLIKRTIERNTLRRSLVRYPDIRKRNQAKKNENSLVERIKKLTCDIDEEEARSSPTGEESKEESKIPAYRKITDIFIRNKEPHPVVLQTPASVEHQYPYYQPYNPPDLGNGLHKPRSVTEARKQFLSSLAPLAACVTSRDDTPGSRDSTSTVDTEYSLNDIDDVLKEQKPQPDIVVGTPGNESDELALFVQQDASRIERLRKRYNSGSDDEHDDYGFNRRPSVRGIKPRFGSTTEILQQMQSQMAPLPSGSHISWPYYDDRNGYRRYEEPHFSQNVIHVGQGQSVRVPYPPGPVQVHLIPQRQVVVRGTQTISTYYQIPRYPRPVVYYPRPSVCSSPTKMKLERGVPEGASSSPHQEHLLPPPPPPANQQVDQPMMYAMNV
ncbi:uncharacterized protein LOC106667355 [Cimex lectularius]|uniref:Uncharacterized protein n=1 Tax=Cimex lectularius TaxID=79782 RepID=A0A8I6THZ5_CIMLE|nr:uncharacterized protein LOC106667355 [Cimex lectularius]